MLKFVRLGWLLCFGCVITAGVLLIRERPRGPHPPITVGPSEFALDDVPLGKREVVVRFENPGTVARRIIGLQEACGQRCCLSSKHPELVSIPAGGTFEYHCEVDVRSAGKLECEMHIYLEDNGIRTVTVRITGTAKGEIPNAPPPNN